MADRQPHDAAIVVTRSHGRRLRRAVHILIAMRWVVAIVGALALVAILWPAWPAQPRPSPFRPVVFVERMP